jgi:hypothetical protein
VSCLASSRSSYAQPSYRERVTSDELHLLHGWDGVRSQTWPHARHVKVMFLSFVGDPTRSSELQAGQLMEST